MNPPVWLRALILGVIGGAWAAWAGSQAWSGMLLILLAPLAVLGIAQWPRFGLWMVLLTTTASPIFPRTLAAQMVNYGLPVLVLGFWFLRIVDTHRDPRPLPKSLSLWFLLFLAFTVVSTLFARDVLAGFAQVVRGVLLLAVLLAYWNLFTTADVKRCLIAYMILCIPIAVYGIWQVATFLLSPTAEWLASVRLSSFYSNPNILGVTMAHCVVVSLALFLNATRGGGRPGFPWRVLMLGLALVAFSAALLGTISRASILYVAAAALALSSAHRSLRWILGSATTAAVLLLLLTPLPSWLTMGFRVGAGDSFRSSLWKAGFHMMLDHPLTGVGPGMGAFEAYRSHYIETSAHRGLLPTLAGGAHNVFLNKGAELGVPGFLLIVALFIILWSRVPGALRDYRQGDWLAGAGAAGMIGLTVRGLFESSATVHMLHVEDSIVFFLFALILVGRGTWRRPYFTRMSDEAP